MPAAQVRHTMIVNVELRMRATFLRILPGFLANGFVAVLVVVAGLALWSRFHLTLRSVGSPWITFTIFLAAFGTPLYALAAWLADRLLVGRASTPAIHFMSAAALYFIVVIGLLQILQRPPLLHTEGGDIARVVGILVASYGIAVNAICIAVRQITLRRHRVAQAS